MKRLTNLFSFIVVCLLLTPTYTFAQFEELDKKPVWVVAHRGDWRNYADNSIEGIKSCIKMGVDIVEIDVSRTKDGVLILMHDHNVDRTTNGKGNVDQLTFDEIQKLNLKNGLDRTTIFKIPTLEEAMLAAKGKIFVNLDKADRYFSEVYHILEKTGTLEQTIIKSGKPYSELKNEIGDKLDKMIFMPVISLNETTTKEELNILLNKKYPFYEIVFEKEHRELLLHIKNKLSNSKSRIWINSLWPSLCAGYCDDSSIDNPDLTWGYLINEYGASILQTDRPQMMINYLNSK